MESNASDDIRREFKALLRNVTDGIDDVPISELGLDSLDFFEFILQLGETHGITLQDMNLDNQLTLNDFISKLANDDAIL